MKINGIEVKTNGSFGFDGCHKFYVAEDDEDVAAMIRNDYIVCDIADLEKDYQKSNCELKFIRNWKLSKVYVAQYQQAIFEK